MQTQIVSTTDSKADVSKAMEMYAKKPVVEEKSAPVPEKETSETTEASEALENEDVIESSELEHDDVDETEVQEESSEAKPKKKGGFQKRIDKLTKGKTLAEQERDYWKDQALKAGQKSDEKKSEPVEAKKEAVKDQKPDPENFRTVAEYYEAMADWKFDQKQKAIEKTKQLESVKTEQEKTISNFQNKVKELTKKAADLPEVLEAVDHIPLSPALQDIFLSAENGHELMYDLAKDPDEYERISKLAPLAAAREMGKREARLAKSASSETTENKLTKAPPPLKPVGSKSSSSSTKDPGEMSYQEYKVWHAKKYGR